MFGKLSYTWELMGASWEVLRRDKILILYPLLSGICCIVVMLSFALPLMMAGEMEDPRTLPMAEQILRYLVLFLFYFCNYFVITFFNVAITACAVSRLAGGEPTFMGGFREAMKRIHLIAGWALVQATIGLILRIIEERSKWVGSVIAGIMGMAFSILSFMVVPILVVEEKGPFAALSESKKLLTKCWGAELAANFSFGLVFFFLSIPAYALIVVGFMASTNEVMFLSIGLGVAYFILLALIQSALSAIFTAALYMHTQGALAGTRGFPVKMLKDALT